MICVLFKVGPGQVDVEFRATAPIYRAPSSITLPDKTSGFNEIAVHDLKY